MEIAKKHIEDFSEFNTLNTNSLVEQVNLLRSELNFLRAQNNALSMEKQKLEKILNDFKNIPGIVGIVSEIYKENIIVRGYNGVVFYVKIPNKFKNKIRVEDRVALAQNNLSIIDVLPSDKDFRAQALELIAKPKISFKDIGGLKDVIREVEETVSLPLRNSKAFEKMGINSPKGILLYGPPGTGKTLLAKAVANNAKATFISLSGSELIHKFIGEGSKIVKDLFKIAREKAPSIIFIDELDAVASFRMDGSNGADREVHRTMMQLLVELDGFKNNDKVKIIAATNRIDILDEAILRPGRFDRIIKVPLPNLEARTEIFKIYIKNIPIDKNVKIKILAKETKGANGADIEAICREAGMFALRNKTKSVSLNDFKDAIKKVLKKEEVEKNTSKMYI